MKRLYAPWRGEYTIKTAQAGNGQVSAQECVFCEQLSKQEDEKFFILQRLEHIAILLNKYPYNPGHLLLLPYVHVFSLEELSTAARIELIEQITRCCIILTQHLNAQGINVGLNLGKAAGAGLPSHLHMHVLPRYFGDTNFLPTLADTKQISQDLHDVYKKLKIGFTY